jgi:hypothetical protein
MNERELNLFLEKEQSWMIMKCPIIIILKKGVVR